MGIRYGVAVGHSASGPGFQVKVIECSLAECFQEFWVLGLGLRDLLGAGNFVQEARSPPSWMSLSRLVPTFVST